jgi:hypothetical protein
VFVSLKLPLYVHEILVHGVESPRNQFADMQTDEGRRFKKGAWILDHAKDAWLKRSHCRGMIPSEQSR